MSTYHTPEDPKLPVETAPGARRPLSQRPHASAHQHAYVPYGTAISSPVNADIWLALICPCGAVRKVRLRDVPELEMAGAGAVTEAPMEPVPVPA